MSAYFTHHLEENSEEIVTHGPGKSLAFVDVGSYEPFVGKDTDELDMMVHLQNQMNALTAFVWDVPDRPLNLRLITTSDHKAMERITFANRPPSASGTVRTYGDLCLVGHDRLLDCARHREHSLLKADRLPKDERPHRLSVPPGIYYVLVYYSGSNRDPLRQVLHDSSKHDYTIFLHHYPHPAPRVAPVRLTGGLIPWAGQEAAAQPWGGAKVAETCSSRGLSRGSFRR